MRGKLHLSAEKPYWNIRAFRGGVGIYDGEENEEVDCFIEES